MLRYLGEKFLSLTSYLGSIGVLCTQTLLLSFVPPFRRKSVFEQMAKIGVESLSLVSLTSLFTGMVLALQSAYQMQKLGAEVYISSLVALSITRELGPVLTALVVAGRMGAAITAELGTMKVTEQIDALETLATNPIKYLVVPRFLALITMLPLLTVYADFIGMLGGFMIGVGKLGIGQNLYIRMTFNTLTFKDVFTGLIKAFFFAVIIAIISCREGMDTEGGAEGVGRATTRAVVFSFILIIAADCLFTALFYFMYR
ncbi:MAG: ABC transporter permease [Candidatus Omnitrophica bacterium]|nr:ABC transporter permease [Candidatus Omnitrophota bacterium]